MSDLTEAEARDSVAVAKRGLEAAADEIVRQISGRAWLSLGYADWDHMREAEYRGAAVIVPRAGRPEIVARLREEGLSHQQIGDTLGVAESTSRSDIRDSAVSPRTRTDALGRERPTFYKPAPLSPGREAAEQANEEQRRRRVATHLLCEHLVTVAQMAGGTTAERYDPDEALPGRAVTRVILDDAMKAIEEIARIWKERELP